jgi:hypothetical protein
MIDGDEEQPTEPSDESAQSDTGLVDASSPVVHRRRRVKAALRHREIERFWQGVFSDPVGRAEMWAILQQAGTFEDRFGVGPNGFPQPEASWFHMGARSLGLRLFQSWCVLAREGVLVMQDEHDPRFARPKMPQTKREK